MLKGYRQEGIPWFAGGNLQQVAQKSWGNIRAHWADLRGGYVHFESYTILILSLELKQIKMNIVDLIWYCKKVSEIVL